ncbi:MAG: hypothetical protein ACRDSR_09310 [Pseudonocardiaceae bacterium]
MITAADYASVHRAMLDGTAARTVPRWTSGVLDEIAQHRSRVTGVRHPLGFVCLPVHRSGQKGVCVHVWSDRFPRESPTTSAVHAHSWDLLSHVLYGSVRNDVIDVTDAPDDGAYRVFEIRSEGDLDEVRRTARLVRYAVTAAEVHRQGDSYSLPAGVFHATGVRGEAATVALGSGRPGMLDLSLGELGCETHQIRRQCCDSEETAHAARVVTDELARIRHS